MLPFQIIAGGSFVADATLHAQAQLNAKPDLFVLRNRTDWGDTTAVSSIESTWRKGMANASAQTMDQAITTNILSSNAVTSNGMTFIDTTNPPTFAALASTTIDKTTFVVSMASTANIFVNDYVRVTVPVLMDQIATYVFQVTAVTANVSITLGYMATAVAAGLTAFAANATSSNIQKIYINKMYPRRAFIALITKAAQAKVYFTASNDFTPGENLGFRVSSNYGMTQINNVTARVLSVVNTATESSVVLDLDSTGFSTFVFPTSAVALSGVTPAIAVPASSGVVPDSVNTALPQQPPGTNLRDAFDNRNLFYMDLGSSVVTESGSTYDWVAYKFDIYNQT